MKIFTVWVGGVEVNDNYLTKKEAENLALKYELDGYDDVSIEEMNHSEMAKAIKANEYSCLGLPWDCHNCPFEYIDCPVFTVKEMKIIVDTYLSK